MQAETTGRDLGDEFDPFSDAHVANPHAFFARARAEQPVLYSPAVDAWLVTRHQDAQAVLKDHRRFAMALYQATRGFTPETLAILRENPITARSLLDVDPPEHTRLRSAISKALSPQRTAALEPRVRELSARLLDELLPLGQADLMTAYASPLPIMVVGSLLGMPEADFPQFLAWSNDRAALLFGDPAPEEQPALARSSVAQFQYIFDMAERRREAPGDDLASDLIRSVEAGEAPLDSMEVAAMLRVLMVAGFETTIKLLGNFMVRLLADRSAWQALIERPASIPDAVEEALRLDGPVSGAARRALQDVEIGGVTIPKDAIVWAVVSSANRDEAAFPEGEAFCPGREGPAPHLAFGFGAHFCAGASLARLEMRVAIEQLTQRFPSLRLMPDQHLEFDRNMFLRGPKAVQVEWDA